MTTRAPTLDLDGIRRGVDRLFALHPERRRLECQIGEHGLIVRAQRGCPLLLLDCRGLRMVGTYRVRQRR